MKVALRRDHQGLSHFPREESLALLPPYAELCDFFLLDAYAEDELGGTGKTFSWDLAPRAKEHDVPIFLAGGLNPDNVAEAIKTTDPYGVDVASGVEKDGHSRSKDRDKMQEFVKNARTVRR